MTDAYQRVADRIALMAEAFENAGLAPPLIVMASWEDQVVFASHVAPGDPIFSDRAPTLIVAGVVIESPLRQRPPYKTQ